MTIFDQEFLWKEPLYRYCNLTILRVMLERAVLSASQLFKKCAIRTHLFVEIR
jgi:hypothetical protein